MGDPRNDTVNNPRRQGYTLSVKGFPGISHTIYTNTPEEDYIARKAIFIHGTASDKNRWKKCSNLTLRTLLKIAKSDDYDIDFDWSQTDDKTKKLNGFLHTVVDRQTAAQRLVKHIEKTAAKHQEIVLIGHSHGGNVAIQAVESLRKQGKTVYLLTIATPAYNKKRISSMSKGNLPDEKRQVGYSIPLRFPTKYYEYKNVENPANIQPAVPHIALWNKYDKVDTIAKLYDNYSDYIGGFNAMTDTSDYFEYNPSVNVAMHIKVSAQLKNKIERVEKNIQKTERRIYEITALKKQLIKWENQGLKLPQLPELKTEPNFPDLNMFDVKIEETRPAIDATRMELPIIPEIKTRTSVISKKAGSLFFEDFDKFKREVDELPAGSIFSKNPKEGLSLMDAMNYDRLHGSANVKMLENEYLRLSKTYSNLLYSLVQIKDEQGIVSSHSFDTATPDEIERAIKEGRIVPFARVLKTKETDTEITPKL